MLCTTLAVAELTPACLFSQLQAGAQAVSLPVRRKAVWGWQVIDDVANMGFSRHEVKAVVLDLMDKGQSVDLNIVLDRLMHGRR